MTTRLSLRDEKLLKKEAYIRRERHVCIGIGIISLIGYIIGRFAGQIETSGSTAIFSVELFFWGYAYYCTLLIRHIESIKAYRVADTGNEA
jgi:hypothetical protein